MLPIWIGPAEASAIAMELQGMKAQRPLTHDLLKQILVGLGVTSAGSSSARSRRTPTSPSC